MFGWKARLVALSALVAITSACGLTEKKFFKKLYKEQCEYQFACYAEASAATWQDESGCRDAYDANVDAGLEFFKGCKYKKGAARDCLKTLKDASCGPADVQAIELACEMTEIWECVKDGETGPCTPSDQCCEICDAGFVACGDSCIEEGQTCGVTADGCACGWEDVCPAE